MKKFYMAPDDQFEYREGEELYHVFERGRLNDFREPYCVSPFLSYEAAAALVHKLNSPPLPMDGQDYHHFNEC